VSELIHKALALFFSVTYLAGIYLVGRNNHDKQVRRMSYLTCALSFLVMLIFLATPKDSVYLLLLESISAMIGQVWVVWISWHSFRANKTNLGTPNS
jgi:predicted MFS family arabinose efflux permease